VFTEKGDLIREHHIYYDNMAMLGQLRALEQPAAAAPPG
jgi:hypothetical protein